MHKSLRIKGEPWVNMYKFCQFQQLQRMPVDITRSFALPQHINYSKY